MKIYKLAILFLCGMAIGCKQAPTDLSKTEKPTSIPAIIHGSFFIEVPLKKEVRFVGRANFDELHGVQANVLYPGNDIGTFLAGIAVHAITSGEVQKNRKKNIVNKANEILIPYSATINNLNYENLLDRALIELNVDSNPFTTYAAQDITENDNWLVALSPTYIMHGDEKIISIESKVSIGLTGDIDDLLAGERTYEKNIVVSSNPLDDPKVWLEDESKLFQDITSSLLAQLVQLAIKDFVGALPANDNKVETIRYLENGSKKIERGRLIEESCQFVLFETLRKGIKLVPKIKGENDCKLITNAKI